jgi:putative oxidoreductase
MSVFVLPLSRALISLLFLQTGYAKVFGWGQIVDLPKWKAYVGRLKIPGTSDPLPQPDLLAQIVAYGELVGGAMLFLGLLSRLTAFGLLVFVIFASVLGHNFWALTDPPAAYMQLQLFLRNMGLIGGLLLILAAGGGSLSIDAMFRREP